MFIITCKYISSPVDATTVILQYTVRDAMFFLLMMCKRQNMGVQQLSVTIVLRLPIYRQLSVRVSHALLAVLPEGFVKLGIIPIQVKTRFVGLIACS